MSDSSISGLTALGQEYEVIAHNLANVSTAGYKRQVGVIAAQTERTGPLPGTTQVGDLREYVFVDFTQGALVHTGRPLDLALHGKGFFVLETPEGPLYTRHGVFTVNAQGQLVDSDGRSAAGEGGPVVIPSSVGPTEVTIAGDGRVLAAGKEIGRLRLVEFEDPAELLPVGRNAFSAPPTAAPVGSPETLVQQGFQEASNVNTVTELVALIQVSRLYEANIKALQANGEKNQAILRVAMA